MRSMFSAQNLATEIAGMDTDMQRDLLSAIDENMFSPGGGGASGQGAPAGTGIRFIDDYANDVRA